MTEKITVLECNSKLIRAREPLFIVTLYESRQTNEGYLRKEEGIFFEGYNLILDDMHPGFAQENSKEGFEWEDKLKDFFERGIEKKGIHKEHMLNVVKITDYFSELGIQRYSLDHRDFHQFRLREYYSHYYFCNHQNFVHVPLTRDIINFLNQKQDESLENKNKIIKTQLSKILQCWQGDVNEKEWNLDFRNKIGEYAYKNIKEGKIRGTRLSIEDNILKVEEPFFFNGLASYVYGSNYEHRGKDMFGQTYINNVMDKTKIHLTEKVKNFFTGLKPNYGS